MMKRLLEITLFSFIYLGLITPGTAREKSGSGLHWNSLAMINQDSVRYFNLMRVDSFKLTVYPPSSGVQFYRDGIVFLSPSKNEVKMSASYVSFGINEAYYVTPVDSVSGNHTPFSASFPFSYPCEGITFTNGYDTMYFTKLPKKDNKEKIFMAKFISADTKQTGWQPETLPLDFCTGDYTYSHPSLSAYNDLMVFASDKEGTQGGMDLFLTRKIGNKWSAPENLGNSINTSGDEFFPFLDSNNNLFFSSDGLPGYGGFDVFTCRFNGTGWDKPINLTNIINSVNDDIAFTINKIDGRTALYTTKGRSGGKEMQLFKVMVKDKDAINSKPTISFFYHGNPLSELKFISALPVPPSGVAVEDPLKQKSEPQASNKEVVSSLSQVKPPPVEKEKVNVSETNLPIVAPPIKVPANVSKTEPDTVKKEIPKKVVPKDEVIYRVQISSHGKSQGIKLINVNGKSYYTFEYYYLNAFRTTIGEFSTLRPAVELQKALRQSGTTQAFVVVFKNNIRSTDPSYFK